MRAYTQNQVKNLYKAYREYVFSTELAHPNNVPEEFDDWIEDYDKYIDVKKFEYLTDEEIKKYSAKHGYDEKSMWFMQEVLIEGNTGRFVVQAVAPPCL